MLIFQVGLKDNNVMFKSTKEEIIRAKIKPVSKPNTLLGSLTLLLLTHGEILKELH